MSRVRTPTSPPDCAYPGSACYKSAPRHEGRHSSPLRRSAASSAPAAMSSRPAPRRRASTSTSARRAIRSSPASRSSWTPPAGSSASTASTEQEARSQRGTSGAAASTRRTDAGGGLPARCGRDGRAMLERLAEVERRYEELERLVADPAVIANRREYARAGARARAARADRRRAIASGSVSSATWRSTASCSQDADAEIREMARGELPALEAGLDALDAAPEGAAPAAAIPTTSATSCSRSAPAPAATRPRSSRPSCSACTARYAERRGWRVEVLSSSADRASAASRR